MLISYPNGSYRKAVGTKSWQYNVCTTDFTGLVKDSPYILDWFHKCMWINFTPSNYSINRVKFTYSDSYHRKWKF